MTFKFDTSGAVNAFDQPSVDVTSQGSESPVTSDSADYKHTFFGILNDDGKFWTPIAFDSEAAARRHITEWEALLGLSLDKHSIVPVRIQLTAFPEARATTDPNPKSEK